MKQYSNILYGQSNNNNLSDFNQLIKIGGDIYKNSIRKQFEPNQRHLIPISGGYDSRGILAALLELTSSENIHTYTFGIPGSYDFEIGNQIATKAGTHHHSYNLKNYSYSMYELLDISKRINHQTILFHHPPISDIVDRYNGFIVWSGVSIESWFGSHYFGNDPLSIDEEKYKFIQSNRYTSSINLINCHYNELYSFIDYSDKKDVPISMILDILNRQMKYNIPHVLFQGLKYNVLFNDDELIKFALSIPKRYLENRYLYHRILETSFPYWFSLPLKINSGLPTQANRIKKVANRVKRKVLRSLTGFNPNVNYLDFNYEIREKPDLKKIIYENIMDLKSRKIVDWIDINDIWNRHMMKQADHADALITLASLEIHLKNGKII